MALQEFVDSLDLLLQDAIKQFAAAVDEATVESLRVTSWCKKWPNQGCPKGYGRRGGRR